MNSSLNSPPLAPLLDRLHTAARADRFIFLRSAPRLLLARLKGRAAMQAALPAMLSHAFIPVSAEQGRFLYLTVRAIQARTIVEFGTSFGISTLYLAAAVKDNGGGRVIGSELEPHKHARASAHLREAGLGDYAEIRLGDALETLRDVPGPIDLILLDGWKDLYVKVLDLLAPKLRIGGVVLADNILTFKHELAPYVARMQSDGGDFVSTTLHIADGFEYSVKVS
jgi:predicted O-methyltransferase YrrM